MSFVGIDVAKAQLEFAVVPSGERGTVANDEAGIRGPAGRLARIVDSGRLGRRMDLLRVAERKADP